MVEKRTLVFVTLAMVVWAAAASTFAGYYYLQFRNYDEQLGETQNLLSRSASNFDAAVRKYDVLSGEYSELYGNYSVNFDTNYAKFIEPFGNLVENLSRSHAGLLSSQEDLNRTYSELVSQYNTRKQQDIVTKEEFGSLLIDYYKLFYTLTLRELARSIGETVTFSVNVDMDYGNGTVVWLNDTHTSAGSTLFELTQKIAGINLTYYAFMEPGHVLIDSINDKAKYTDPSYTWGYSWIWYYWDSSQKKWIVGPVGCDAWLLKDGGIYKWNYEYWKWP